MDLVYVDKLAKDNNGVKYLLVRQDLFFQNRRCKRNEDKRLEGNSQDLFKNDYQKEKTKANLGRLGERIWWRIQEGLRR